jgi:hypothetical protein
MVRVAVVEKLEARPLQLQVRAAAAAVRLRLRIRAEQHSIWLRPVAVGAPAPDLQRRIVMVEREAPAV